MAHGAPDNYDVRPKITTYRLDDMAELAVRLGSPDLFDRLGDVVFMDNFSDGKDRWVEYTSGASAAVALATNRYSSGGFCCKLTTGSTLDKKAQINHIMPYAVISKFGFEFAFASQGNVALVRNSMLITDGTKSIWGEVHYVPSGGLIRYHTIPNTWVTLASGVGIYSLDYNFHRMKMVVDFDNEVYIRFILDETVYPMKDIPLYTKVEATDPRLEAIIFTYHSAGVNAVTYVDDIIVTQNEP